MQAIAFGTKARMLYFIHTGFVQYCSLAHFFLSHEASLLHLRPLDCDRVGLRYSMFDSYLLSGHYYKGEDDIDYDLHIQSNALQSYPKP